MIRQRPPDTVPLFHSVGGSDPLTASEADARQYVPEASREWDDRLPGIFRVTDGVLHTACLADRPGLGAGT